MSNPTVILPATHGSRSVMRWLEFATAWAERLAASRPVALVVFTILYLIPTVRLSRYKLFWDDEFFTLYLSRTSDWKTLLEALGTGADQHPPSFYYLTHWIIGLFGTSHLSLRLTAIAGFWLLCICMYEIVKVLANPMWAVVAMLFPLTTNLYYYATEARGYGLVVGFAALAVLSWLRASAYQQRRVYIPLLAFSLAAAVASHYYAALVVVCLGLGELVRTISRRKVDLPIWVAFVLAGLPILLFLRTIQSAQGYSSHFWAVPVWSDAINFYPGKLGLGPIALLGTLAVAMCFQVGVGDIGKARSADLNRQASLNVWQATAICCLSALPLIVMIVAKFVTHGYTARYAIAAIVGLTILFSYFLYRVTPQPTAAVVAALICVGAFGFQVHELRGAFYDQRSLVASDISVLSKTGNQQIAVAAITAFHRLSFYAPRDIATRLTYVADPISSIKYLDQDTVDRGLLDLNPWFPLKVIPLQSFLEDNHEFLFWGSIDRWGGWLTFDLPKWGNTVLLERNEGRLLLSVSGVRVTLSAAVIQPQRAAASRMLYWKTPQTGPSLCKVYMGPNICP